MHAVGCIRLFGRDVARHVSILCGRVKGKRDAHFPLWIIYKTAVPFYFRISQFCIKRICSYIPVGCVQGILFYSGKHWFYFLHHKRSVTLTEMLRRDENPADVQFVSLQKQDRSADDPALFCQFIQMPLPCHLRMKGNRHIPGRTFCRWSAHENITVKCTLWNTVQCQCIWCTRFW